MQQNTIEKINSKNYQFYHIYPLGMLKAEEEGYRNINILNFQGVIIPFNSLMRISFWGCLFLIAKSV